MSTETEFLSVVAQDIGRASSYSPLTLAYIGDAVYDLLVRSELMRGGNMQAGKLHIAAKEHVKAAAQSAAYHRLLPYLSENETDVIKRGRNAKSPSKAKHADVSDYRHATGVEALFGYLYLNGEHQRIAELFRICYQKED